MKNITIVALAIVLLAVCIYDVSAKPGDGGKGKEDHKDSGKDDGKKDGGKNGGGKNDGKGKGDDSSSSESDEHNGKGKNNKGDKKWWR